MSDSSVSCGVALWEEVRVVLSRGGTESGWAPMGCPGRGLFGAALEQLKEKSESCV